MHVFGLVLLPDNTCRWWGSWWSCPACCSRSPPAWGCWEWWQRRWLAWCSRWQGRCDQTWRFCSCSSEGSAQPRKLSTFQILPMSPFCGANYWHDLIPKMNTTIGLNHPLTTLNFLNCKFCFCFIIKMHKKREKEWRDVIHIANFRYYYRTIFSKHDFPKIYKNRCYMCDMF